MRGHENHLYTDRIFQKYWDTLFSYHTFPKKNKQVHFTSWWFAETDRTRHAGAVKKDVGVAPNPSLLWLFKAFWSLG